MSNPANLMYTKSHEWVEKTGEGAYKIGLTDHAQHELGDIVFVNLPAVGDSLVIGDSFSDVESVKAVADVYSPVTGTVAAVNETLLDEPQMINTNCYDAWLVEASDVSATEEMLTADQYDAFVAEGN